VLRDTRQGGPLSAPTPDPTDTWLRTRAAGRPGIGPGLTEASASRELASMSAMYCWRTATSSRVAARPRCPAGEVRPRVAQHDGRGASGTRRAGSSSRTCYWSASARAWAWPSPRRFAVGGYRVTLVALLSQQPPGGEIQHVGTRAALDRPGRSADGEDHLRDAGCRNCAYYALEAFEHQPHRHRAFPDCGRGPLD
jgi:hypothetical protein